MGLKVAYQFYKKVIKYKYSNFKKGIKNIINFNQSFTNSQRKFRIFDFQNNPNDKILWHEISDSSIYGGNSQSKIMSQDTKQLTVSGKISFLKNNKTEIDYAFAGITTEHCIESDCQQYNGVRITLKTDHPLKVQFQFRETLQIARQNSAMWYDSTGEFATYQIPFSFLTFKIGNQVYYRDQSGMTQEITRINIIAQNDKEQTPFQFSLKSIDLIFRPEFQQFERLGYKMPVMIKYQESYTDFVDNFVNKYRFNTTASKNSKSSNQFYMGQSNSIEKKRMFGDKILDLNQK